MNWHIPFWVKILKVGDPCYTIVKTTEKACFYKSFIRVIESNYIETEFVREHKPEYDRFIRAYEKTTVKNYFNPNGDINVIPISVPDEIKL